MSKFITLKLHCGTCWSTEKQVVNIFKNNIKGIYEILKKMSEDMNHKTKDGAKNVLYCC